MALQVRRVSGSCDMEDEVYRDHCLIIVGDGGQADKVLAKRRLAAGGRLAHFLVQDEQVRASS